MRILIAVAILAASMFAAVPTGTQKVDNPIPIVFEL